MAIFYIADTHFGHENIIRFDKRPFANVEMMKNDMIERWNKKLVRMIPCIYSEIFVGKI